MPGEDDDDTRHDPTEIVGPFARIRIIAAVIVILIGLAILAYRILGGG